MPRTSKRLKPDNTAGRLLQIVLWAEQPEVGRDKAYDRYRELAASLQREGKSGPFDFLTLFVLGTAVN